MKYTPTEILLILKERHRLCSPLDFNTDPEFDINGEITIDDWRSAGDLMNWKKLGFHLNDEFNINISKQEWKAVLTPYKKRKLWGVCKLISQKAEKEEIQPIKLLGHKCMSSAIFKIIKKSLKDKGVNTIELKPSSKVKYYITENYSEVIGTITKFGFKIIERLELRRKINKRGFWSKINIFDYNSHEVIPIGITTFRDIVEKIMEKNDNVCA